MKRAPKAPRQRDALRLSHAPLGSTEPISNLSWEEQSRMLALADQALHNTRDEDGNRLRAGDRAHDDHERLKKELRAEVARFERQKKIWQRLK